MVLYFLIDTSGSMDGAKIASVNDTMENVISELKLHSNNNDIYINVLSFARKSKLMFNRPIKIDNFVWDRLYASGMTSLGNACKQLATDIEKYVQQEDLTLLLLSDGLPTDDYDEGLETLNKCLSNKNVNRYAIALDGSDIVTVNKFTNNPDNVFQLESLDNLLELILSVITMPRNIHNNRRNNDIDDEWA